jgi:hypothetical protein
MGRHQSIPLSSIITSPRLQNRNAAAPCLRQKLTHSQVTIEHLDTLKLAIRRGDHIPPVSVVRAEHERGERFYLVDGFHRFWAHGFYPISTDGLKRAENFRSCRATLRRIRGL